MANQIFETTIKNYLDNRAREDSLFAETYKKANKNLKECCKYIYLQARKLAKGSNSVGIDDATVYGWAVHYYDEDDIKVSSASASVEVTTPVAVVKPELAKPAAPKRQKAKKTNHRADDSLQLSLFGEL